MTSPDHITKLKENVKAWNFWRPENGDIVPDLNHMVPDSFEANKDS